jgi:hypothetical protein
MLISTFLKNNFISHFPNVNNKTKNKSENDYNKLNLILIDKNKKIFELNKNFLD